jgi:hypothetical protein
MKTIIVNIPGDIPYNIDTPLELEIVIEKLNEILEFEKNRRKK